MTTQRVQRHGVLLATLAVILLVGWSTKHGVMASEQAHEHEFKEFDHLPVKVNKLGPYSNPSETYPYYSLPFCAPADIKKDSQNLGAVLEGDRVMNSLYDVRFRVNERARSICRVTYTTDEAEKLKEAVEKNYYFQMFFDNLPVWGFIGEMNLSPEALRAREKLMEQQKRQAAVGEKVELPPIHKEDLVPYLYPHLHFDVAANGPHVIEVNVTADARRRVLLTDLSKPLTVEYSYSVLWKETPTTFEKRLERYNRYSFFPYEVEVQWFSILNSLFLVVLLVALISFILIRILKRDYEKIGSLDEDSMNETGWKMLHGDVFRIPTFPFARSFLASIIGTGAQFAVLAMVLLTLGLFDYFSAYERGTLYSAILITYALTSWIAGFVSTYTYLKLAGEKWVHNCLLTCSLFPLPAFVVWAFLNSVAIAYGSTAALPFGTIVVIFLLWGLVTFPLTVLGAITGKKISTPLEPPCRVRTVPRQVPDLPWYRGIAATTLVAGLVPFTAIYIEIYYLFASLWSHRLYTPYGIMALTFFILLTVTSCVSVAVTYYHLSMEDYRWWLRSVLTGGSAALIIFAYCFFFLPSQSDMQGFLQVSFYFGYMFLISYAFFLLLGAVGFVSSYVFINKIYQAVKFD